MRPTRRWWALAGTAAVLLGVALVGERPLPLVGAASLGAFCLVAAVRAATTFAATSDEFVVDVRALPRRATAGGDTTLSIDLTLGTPASHPVALDCAFPVGVSGEPTTLDVAPGESSARAFVAATFPVAGRFDLPDLSCTFSSADGLFTQRLPLEGARTTVIVEAPSTGDVHIGAGGAIASNVFGGHRGNDTASRGDDLSSIREYTPSDAATRIDWKATARLDEPFVREYEASHEQDTRLIVDARRGLLNGEPGRRKIDFLREVGLSVLGSAERADDPLALTVVDDGGVRTTTAFAGTIDHYRRIRTELLDLGAETSPAPAATSRSEPVTVGSDEAWTAFARLSTRQDEDSAFAATLRPFFRRTDSYVERAADDPLVAAVRRHAREGALGTLTVVLTDDADRGRLREAVKIATRNDGLATAFVAPDVLFDPGSVADLDAAYRRFAEFEAFRRTLDRLPRVSAYEVGPDDRLRALFARRPGRSRSRVRPGSRTR